MSAGRFRTEHAVMIGGIALLLVAGLVFGQRPRGLAKDQGLGSTRFAARGGGKALYTLLRKLGCDVSRHERRIELLDDEVSVLAIVLPKERLTEEEAAWLVSWVEGGGTLVWISRVAGEPLLEAFGFSLENIGSGDPSPVTAKLGPSATQSYTLSVTGSGRLRSGARPEVLAEDADGWIAVAATRGKGRFIAISEPELASNAGLSTADHAEFMVHLFSAEAGGGPIAFDEFHHGFVAGQTAFAIIQDSPLAGAIVLVIVAAIAGVFAHGRRLGPPIDLHEERRRRPAEFMDAYARLCRRAKAGPQVLTLILAELQASLQKRFGAATPEAVEALAVRSGLPPGRAAGALAGARALAALPSADDADLLARCRDLEAVRQSLLKNRSS